MKDNDGTTVVSSFKEHSEEEQKKEDIFKEKIDCHSVFSMRYF